MRTLGGEDGRAAWRVRNKSLSSTCTLAVITHYHNVLPVIRLSITQRDTNKTIHTIVDNFLGDGGRRTMRELNEAFTYASCVRVRRTEIALGTCRLPFHAASPGHRCDSAAATTAHLFAGTDTRTQSRVDKLTG